ncbi:hypothetical protein TcBrA4_0014480 [Trypanosoma cruzi]|nr:hypothetical protein TcBrA4_0014480 [Trypanosoma cruzi]
MFFIAFFRVKFLACIAATRVAKPHGVLPCPSKTQLVWALVLMPSALHQLPRHREVNIAGFWLSPTIRAIDPGTTVRYLTLKSPGNWANGSRAQEHRSLRHSERSGTFTTQLKGWQLL